MSAFALLHPPPPLGDIHLSSRDWSILQSGENNYATNVGLNICLKSVHILITLLSLENISGKTVIVGTVICVFLRRHFIDIDIVTYVQSTFGIRI